MDFFVDGEILPPQKPASSPNRMSSRKTNYGQQRQNRDWGARQWTDSEDRQTERGAPGNGLAKDFYHRYAGEAYTRKRQASRDLHYRNSPDSNYCEEPLNRDRSGSPGRSRYAAVTPKQHYDRDRGSAERSEDDQELARKKNELRMIKEQIAHKRAAIEHETCKTSTSTKLKGPARKYRRFTEDVEDDFTCPLPSNYERNIPLEDKDIRKVDIWPQEYTSSSRLHSRSPALLQPVLQMAHVDRMDNCFLHRHRQDSHRQDTEGHPQSQSMRAPTFQSNEKDREYAFDATSRRLTPQCTVQNTAGEGFQRFLSVLNKGVDLNMLNRIANNVDQGAIGGGGYRQNFPQEKYPLHSGEVQPRSQGSCGLSQLVHDTHSYSGERSTNRPSLEPVPMDLLVRNELPCQDRDIDDRKGSLRFDKVSMSQVLEETKMARPEDLQVQNVLQAIGLELGVDELGQLSNRIQERLYGKKREGVTKESDKNKHSKRDSVTRRDSRSSSSSSSCASPCHSQKHASADASRNHTELNFKPSLDCDTDKESQEISVAAYHFPQNPICPTSYSLPAPMMPTYTLHPAYQRTPPVLENPLFPGVTTVSSFPSATSQYSYTETKRQLTYITLQTDSTNLSHRHRCLKTVETNKNDL